MDVEDLRFEVHTSGPHVAVRITHVPTGLVAEAVSDSLGQWRVKQQALAELERKVAEPMVLAGFRDTFGDCSVDWSEYHFAHCPDTVVARYTETGPDTFSSVLKCPHQRPMGYSVGPEEAT